ncbi:hypothetical protein BGX33_006349 [Mortierella sp. NVP41]|nr:hypothetical protein BGX33_006349 [Mortierella sp. NVP41]
MPRTTTNPMAPIKALELPEILYRVGLFLPFWEQQEERPVFEGLPTRLVTVIKPDTSQVCICVSNLWCKFLNLILWYTCDDAVRMVVPPEIVVLQIRQNPHLRALGWFGYMQVLEAEDFRQLHRIQDFRLFGFMASRRWVDPDGQFFDILKMIA